MDDRFRIDDDPPKNQAGLWVAAAALAGLLVFYHAFGSSEDEQTQLTATAAALAVKSQPITKNIERPTIQWPEVKLNDLIDNNPFNPRRSLERAIHGTEEDQAEIQFVQQQLGNSRSAKRKQQEAIAKRLASDQWKVRLLLNGRHGTAALIGERVVNVGDEIDGFKVVGIQRDGVELQPISDDE